MVIAFAIQCPKMIGMLPFFENFKQLLKRSFFGSGLRMMEIIAGLGRGIFLKMDPQYSMQRMFGLEEWEISSYFRQLASQVLGFVEIGASNGYYSLLAHRFNPSKRLVALCFSRATTASSKSLVDCSADCLWEEER